MEGLGLENILSQEQVENLFTEDSLAPETEESEGEATEKKDTGAGDGPDDKFTEEQIDNLFASESVGVTGDQGKTSSGYEAKSSPNKNFYSSTLNALVGDGVFTGLSEEDIAEVKDAESFAKAVEKVISSKFDERQKRIDDALNAQVEPDEIKKNESIISFLDSVTEEALTEESGDGEKLRRDIIVQDLLNRGITDENRIRRELKKSFDSGEDIQDAKDALAANKEFFKSKYNELIRSKKEAIDAENLKIKNASDELKKSIIDAKSFFGDIKVDSNIRQKIYDNVAKPVYKDEKTGEMLTPIQKYQRENKTEFLKNLGIIYTLTDGFKNIDGLVKGKVKKEVRQNLKELEHTINSTSRNSDGSLAYVTGIDDKESYSGLGWRIDI